MLPQNNGRVEQILLRPCGLQSLKYLPLALYRSLLTSDKVSYGEFSKCTLASTSSPTLPLQPQSYTFNVCS